MAKENNNITQREEKENNSSINNNNNNNCKDKNKIKAISNKAMKKNKKQNKKQKIQPKPSGSAISSLAEVGLIFKTRRKKKRMLQTTIAGLSNVGNRFISDLENGKSTMWFDKVLKVLNDNGIQLTINYNDGGD